ncbi:hypothetical protein LITTLEE_143 [Mycobacterium phage LittleE]|uniref:Uncharacterized protein n=4 Tax=Omegavirus TaxID=1623292 RepID=G1D428_9CAUD|nr:hypothetical protein CM09_gp136 [Mycobacterium phage Courthouse]YP_009637054.1 hypothetical protein FGG27_gp143 [Mycobacterium phage LittleE]AEK09523.1 hypothetical protein LITTLEE_143 [Mycobacterium phage LittleE]AER47987.1 hypothetical protein COURTHOUSE_136 [Mycobacterium phage Courthouse]ATS92979.1 hypothetical protein SEA_SUPERPHIKIMAN_138 [Mycobacterium phage Superphikiman]
MKTVISEMINWPVAEPGDFDTIDLDQRFFVMEDEDGDRYYAFGHVSEQEMYAEVNRYLRHMIPSGDFDDAEWGGLQHVYAKFVDRDGERFSLGAAPEDPHAFPMTVATL